MTLMFALRTVCASLIAISAAVPAALGQDETDQDDLVADMWPRTLEEARHRLALEGCPEPTEQVTYRGPIDLTVNTAQGDFVFKTDIAMTRVQRANGMKFRTEIAPDQAMLFIDRTDQIQSFWMKDTCVSLDLIWIRSDWTVAGMSENAVPLNANPDDRLLSEEPVRYVLEIPGGRAAEIGLQPGDRIAFGRSSADG